MFPHRNRVITSAIVIALGLFLQGSPEPALGQAKPATPSTNAPSTPTTGQRIGQIIKDAIGTAFPGVAGIGGLIDAIWAKKPNNGNSVNKDQLTQATTNAQGDAKKLVVAQFQQNVTPLEQVAAELQIVSQFGVPTVTANEAIIKMSGLLNSGKPLTPDDWTVLRGNWDVAKNELQTIKNVPDLSKVQDLWLRDKLSKIQQSNVTTAVLIDNELKPNAPNIARLTQDLNDLYATLKDISAAVGYEVSNMQVDMKSLSDWAKGAASGGETALSPEGTKYVKFLNGRYH